MGQVIEFRPLCEERMPASQMAYRCTRCGADLWNLLADGHLRCADCEQECSFRVVLRNEAEIDIDDGKRG